MYEFVCERLIPGCTTKERAETREEAAEKGRKHLHEHHDVKHLDAGWDAQIRTAVFEANR